MKQHKLNDGYVWKDGRHQILMICHPREKEVFG